MKFQAAFWWVRTVGILVTVATLAWSGVRPSSDDPKAWYDEVMAVSIYDALVGVRDLATCRDVG